MVSTASLFGASTKASAQTYPIDCAILLCLSGGWPASEPCSRARAEFIRRITPWPVEPPLQIWRCPMGASFEPVDDPGRTPRVFDFSNASHLPQSLAESDPENAGALLPAVLRSKGVDPLPQPDGFALHLIQNRADIDISGPEFNFVRSIRVYDVRYAQQVESRDSDCSRYEHIRLGTYGTQGDFSWSRSSVAALPEAHVGLERWGDHCPSIYHRSVFVDWRDYEGNYGFEQVNY
ncbi:hypothetical protein CVM52_01595 [Pseudooceanicola lipolyticus]|uniref:Uncharacterized protein n=1 Tax=Pseudooceanicola lipolyticus TaxID=2029104 RepID=A0A2M8J6X6_9RHOB|nr:hypothetical protein CVM52_01595 [Pseudooceanicola lipolyticus]